MVSPAYLLCCGVCVELRGCGILVVFWVFEVDDFVIIHIQRPSRRISVIPLKNTITINIGQQNTIIINAIIFVHSSEFINRHFVIQIFGIL